MGTIRWTIAGMFNMKPIWLANIIDPEKANSETIPFADFSSDHYSLWKNWVSDKAIGDPQPADGLSVDDLKAQGYVGVYRYVRG
jgi:hypothetical protein